MTITVDIDGKPTEITLTPEQVAAIEAQNKPKTFEWNYTSSCNTYYIASDCIRPGFGGTDINHLEHGRCRLTKEVAIQSLLRNTRANRLEALAEQLGGLTEWEENKNVGYIRFAGKEWDWYYGTTWYSPEKVYMTKDCAIEICRMLNTGEFSLDGEL